MPQSESVVIHSLGVHCTRPGEIPNIIGTLSVQILKMLSKMMVLNFLVNQLELMHCSH